MKKLDNISEDTVIPCPNCYKPMTISSSGTSFFPFPTFYDNLVNEKVFVVCENEACKFIGIKRTLNYLLSDKFWGKEK